MSVDIEGLSFEISGNSSNAADSIDKMRASLEKLKTATKGGTGLASLSKQLKTISTALNGVDGSLGTRLRSLADGLTAVKNASGFKLSSSLAIQLTNIGNSVKQLSGVSFGKISELAISLRELSNIGRISLAATFNQLKALPGIVAGLDTVNMDKLRTTLTELSTAMSSLQSIGRSNLGAALTQLRKLPEVARTLEEMDSSGKLDVFAVKIRKVSNALAPLAANMSAISSAFGNFPTKINKVANSLDNTNASCQRSVKSMASLAAMTGACTAAYYSLRRVAGILGDLLDDSNQYVEVLNLAAVTLRDNVAAATEYASTVERAMGINSVSWLEGLGTFNQMLQGFQIGKDAAYEMSTQLTQVAYDIQSLYNVKDIQTVMDKLQSGISGQIKGMRDYGVELSVAALQEYALSKGITQKVMTMTQAQKAMLRYMKIMETTSNVQGDLARTIATPANAMRIVASQFEVFKRKIGDVVSVLAVQFIPVFQAIISLITEAAKNLAAFFGYELPEIDYSGLDNVTYGVDDVTEGLDNATDASNKLKRSLAGFDQLNILSSNGTDTDTSASAVGELWDISGYSYDFLANVDTSKADEITEKIRGMIDAVKNSGPVKALAGFLKGLYKNAVKPLFKFVLDNWDGIVKALEYITVAIVAAKAAIAVTSLISNIGAIISAINPVTAIVGGVAAAIALVGYAIYDSWENAKRADLEGRFGDITLSMEEMQKIADKIVGSEIDDKVAAVAEAFDKVDTSLSNAKDAAETLTKTNWEISMGFTLSQDEIDEYKEHVGQLIDSVKTAFNDQQYALNLSIKTMITDADTAGAIQSNLSAVSTSVNAYLTSLGDEMADLVNKAFEDGFMDIDELEAVAKLQEKMANIQRIMAESDYTAQLETIKAKYGAALTPETYKAFQEAINTAAVSRMEAKQDEYTSTLSALITTVKVAEETGDNAAVMDAKAALETFQSQDYSTFVYEPLAEANKFALGTITAAYPQMRDTISKLGSVFEVDIANGGDFSSLVTFEKLQEIQYPFSDVEKTNLIALLTMNLDAITQLRNLHDELVSEGKEIPNWLNESLAGFYAVEAGAGVTARREYFDSYAAGYLDLVKLVGVDNGTAFMESFLSSATGGIVSGLNEGINTAVRAIELTADTKTAVANQAAIINGILSNALSGVSSSALSSINLVSSMLGIDIKIPTRSSYVKQYASGGFPSRGEMFIANEAGPELVGTIGNKAAVANENQLIAALETGVYRAVVSAMQSGKGQVIENNITLELDGDVVGESVTRYQTRQVQNRNGRRS